MRGFYILLFLALLVVLAIWAGWFKVSRTKTGEKTSVTATVNKDEIKRDIERAERGIRDLGEKHETLTPTPPTNLLTLDKDRVELAPGQSAEIIVTRTGNLDAQPLTIKTSDGSGLLTEAPSFKDGQETSVVVIKAPEGARGGMIAIEYKGETQAVEVDVTTKTNVPTPPAR